MMREVFEALEKEGIETELVQFAGTVIEPCKACWACAGRGNCVHKNDCFREVFEKMKEADSPHTAHTTGDVRFVLVSSDDTLTKIKLREGKLADIMPTILDYLGLNIPEEETGKTLIIR